MMEAGKVRFPVGAPWLSDLISECMRFPAAAQDDMVDALVMAIQRLRCTDAIRQRTGGAMRHIDDIVRHYNRPRTPPRRHPRIIT